MFQRGFHRNFPLSCTGYNLQDVHPIMMCCIYITSYMQLLYSKKALMETSHWLVAISLLSLVTALPISEFFEFDIHKSCNISIKEDVNNQLSDKCNELYFPREVNCSVVYQVDTAFPLFDEIVTTIKVSNSEKYLNRCI